MIDGVEKYVFLLGWPRSGHSIVGSLLNAHPDMVISNEYNIRQKHGSLQAKRSFFNALYERSIPSNNSDLTTDVKGYTLDIAGSWQGR